MLLSDACESQISIIYFFYSGAADTQDDSSGNGVKPLQQSETRSIFRIRLVKRNSPAIQWITGLVNIVATRLFASEMQDPWPWEFRSALDERAKGPAEGRRISLVVELFLQHQESGILPTYGHRLRSRIPHRRRSRAKSGCRWSQRAGCLHHSQSSRGSGLGPGPHR